MTSAYNKYKGHFMGAKQKVCFYLGWWKWYVWWWKWKVLNKDTQVSPISCKLLFESFRETDFSIRRDKSPNQIHRWIQDRDTAIL